jgi:S-adenosylmethionine hydrolase
MAVVDPGVGTQRDIVVVEANGHIFLAPDNGLLAAVLARAETARIHRLDSSRFGALGIGTASATFHGRDIFAPIAAEIAAGRLRPANLGPEVAELVPAWVEDPVTLKNQVSGVVITVDHFGNLVTNIDAEMVRNLANPVVLAGNHEFPLKRTYGDVKPGDYLALINSFGVVEIALAERSAAQGLGLGRGAPVVVVAR